MFPVRPSMGARRARSASSVRTSPQWPGPGGSKYRTHSRPAALATEGSPWPGALQTMANHAGPGSPLLGSTLTTVPSASVRSSPRERSSEVREAAARGFSPALLLTAILAVASTLSNQRLNSGWSMAGAFAAASGSRRTSSGMCRPMRCMLTRSVKWLQLWCNTLYACRVNSGLITWTRKLRSSDGRQSVKPRGIRFVGLPNRVPPGSSW
mmetsp:Transcript_75838/g.245584  ORF Transcript_75838/g.245584 Transcript_75838/m.245584 type:complete len:210 (-) Transcript_75838:906-1535(-)